MLRKNPEVSDFARLSPAMTVAEAERALGVGMRGGLRYGVIIAEAGQPLTCITWQHLEVGRRMRRWRRSGPSGRRSGRCRSGTPTT